jgi:hypothetical protein
MGVYAFVGPALPAQCGRDERGIADTLLKRPAPALGFRAEHTITSETKSATCVQNRGAAEPMLDCPGQVVRDRPEEARPIDRREQFRRPGTEEADSARPRHREVDDKIGVACVVGAVEDDVLPGADVQLEGR